MIPACLTLVESFAAGATAAIVIGTVWLISMR